MLTNKVALITGGARGIRAGIGRVMAGQGARVALLDLDGTEAEKTAAGLPTPGVALACDVGVEADVATAVQAVVEQFDGLDILVNNAGMGRPVGRSGRVDDMSAAEWDEQLAQDLRTTFVTTKAAAPYLKARGGEAIVNIASITGLVASPGIAAQAGMISLTICPGFVWSRPWEHIAAELKRRVPEFAELDAPAIFQEVVKDSLRMKGMEPMMPAP